MGKKANIAQEEFYQAVIIADPFSPCSSQFFGNQFSVASSTLSYPNVEILLNACLKASVKEVFIVGRTLDLLWNYLRSTGWLQSVNFTISRCESEELKSIGDAIRLLHELEKIRFDFLLFCGPVITNMEFSTMLDQHKRRRKKTDRKILLSAVFSPTSEIQRAFSVVTSSETGQIKRFTPTMFSLWKRNKEPLDVSEQLHERLEFAGVFTCSPNLPSLFNNEHDQTMSQLIIDCISNEEVWDSNVYAQVTGARDFACMMSDFSSLLTGCRQFLGRWAYPYVVERVRRPVAFRDNTARVLCWPFNVYANVTAKFGRNCALKQCVYVGSGSTIGDNCILSNVTVGKNCSIDSNVTLTNCVIGDDVSIGAGSSISNSILLDGCQLGANCSVPAYNLICAKTVVASDVEVAERRVICPDKAGWKYFEPDFNFILTILTSIQQEYGLRPVEADARLEDDEFRRKVFHQVVLPILWADGSLETVSDQLKPFLSALFPSIVDDDVGDSDTSSESSNSDSGEEIDIEDIDEINPVEMEDGHKDMEFNRIEFRREIAEIIKQHVEENSEPYNTIVEVNSQKSAYNITVREVNPLIMRSVLQMSVSSEVVSGATTSESKAMAIVGFIKKVTQKIVPVFENYVKDDSYRVDILKELETFVLKNRQLFVDFNRPLVAILVQFWYNSELVDEEAVFNWFSGVSDAALRKQLQPFINWLQTAEEESDSSAEE